MQDLKNILFTMEGPVINEQKKEMCGKDGSSWESEASRSIFRGGDCCFNSCVYTTDHYHCQGCGIGTAEVSQALAHIRTSPACRKDSLVHYSASSVGLATDPTNSLYNAIYTGFTAQNSYPGSSFTGFSQMDSFQWHPTMSDKVAICSTQLSPCCSSNGGSYIPVESQLCSPISDLYSKVTAPIRDLVSLPAKSSGSAMESQAWFAAYNPQQIQKTSLKFSDQNPPQISFILLDPSDQKHQELGETNSNNTIIPANFCSKPDISVKDINKESYCAYTSQALPALLSEDALFSLQLQDDSLKQADLQQQSVSQILLSDVNLQGKNIPPVESMPSTSRVETHFTQEHFGHYMSSCSAFSSQLQNENNLENQPSSAASDSDESDIIVEDTGDDLGSQMTESEIFIEDIKCSLLQGVVNEEENSPLRNPEVLQNKSIGDHRRQDSKSCGIMEEPKMQSESGIKGCMSTYHTLLKCVVCEKSVSDGNPGSVLVQMNNQMPLTTSSHTPVLTKLNEVVAIEVTDFLDVNGKFMCQSCFKLVDTVDSLESKLESLKQDIAALIKSGSKPLILRHSPCAKLAVDLLGPDNSVMNISPKVKVPSNSDTVHELLQDSIIENSTAEKPVISEHGLRDNVEQREYLLLSGRALSLANSIDKVSLSLGQHHQVELVVPEEQCGTQPSLHLASCAVPKITDLPTSHYQMNSVDSVSKEREAVNSHVGNYIGSHSNQQETALACSEENKQIYELSQCEKTSIKLQKISGLEEHNLGEVRAPHSSECTMENCHEILRLEQKLQENPPKSTNTFEKYTCNLCSETFSSNNLLENHKAKFTKTDPSLCEVCGQLFHSQVQLEKHLFQIHYIYRKHCEFCGMKIHHPCMYEVHMRNHPEGSGNVSQPDGHIFSLDITTLPNSSGFIEKNVVNCESCEQTFPSLSHLEKHIKSKHTPKKTLSKCDQCDRTYSKPSDLQAHRRSHSNEKNFECKVCKRRYKSLGNLNHHAKTHCVKKPYTCEICSQGFIRKDFFETHINSHKDNKPYKCEKCDKGFLSKSYLQVHLKWHLDKIKKVTCPICHKTYSQRLNVHMRSHTGERPHPCQKCPKRFITGSALRKHFKRIHKENLAEDGCSVSEDSDSDDGKPRRRGTEREALSGSGAAPDRRVVVGQGQVGTLKSRHDMHLVVGDGRASQLFARDGGVGESTAILASTWRLSFACARRTAPHHQSKKRPNRPTTRTMSPPGVRRHRRRDSEDGDLDRRHPFENVPRFRSPSRPQRSADVDDFRRLGLAVATSCMIQSVLWAGMTTAAILVYRDIVPVPEIPPPDTGSWEDFETILTYSYFKEGAILPAAAMPEQGLVTPLTMYRMMSSAFLISVFWFICSAVLFAKLRSGGPRSWVLSIRVWAFSTSVVTIMDVVLGSAMIRDLVVLSEKESSAGADKALVSKLSHCAAVVLVVALRAGLLLFANVGLMIALLYLLSNRLNPPTRLASAPPGGESPSATKREGPIDAFLFSSSSFRSNDGQSGIRNPAFVPDDRIAPAGGPPHSLTNWTSFKPPPEGPRQPQPQPGPDGPRSSNPKRLRRITSKELEDMAHLSWMEEPQRHVDVELRRPLGWPGPGPGTPPPADARHAVFEPEVPELPDGHTGRGPDFGFSYLHGPGHILPRARINPEAAAAAARPPPGPGAPNIPPPDYSPRAPGRRAREQAGT
ncbi:Zinc finger imprinted 3 [Frankliniella fusca]|uniref:Zinc finger imprinted 3 n=1 Tax=Frankliniella fusca TaxID=407009 RepID=A0AAE1LUF9_9NEOP|nr:Zinc finger imprinted 3 [Frankliniella fusca]